MKNRIKSLSFLTKIRLMYGVMLVVPILLLGGFIFYSSSSFIREKQRDKIEDTVGRNVQEIQNRMQQLENSLRYLASNYSFQEFIQIPKSHYRERNEMAKYIGPLIYNTQLSNQLISKIQVYSPYEDATLGGQIKKEDKVKGEQWYKETVENDKVLWWIEDGKSYITRQIINYYPKRSLGVIRIDVKDTLWKETFEIFNDILLRVEMSDGEQTLYQYENFSGSDLKKEEYKITEELPMSGWKVEYYISKKNLSPYLHSHMIVSMVIIAFLLAFVWIAINRSSRSILKNLYGLITEVKQVRDGNLHVEIDVSAQDEIGELARNIDRMLKKINHLIEQIYKADLEKKDLELNLLQSKISPHFLYNNLSAINWIAIEKEEDEIYEITTQMAAFYRTALNKGKNIDRLAVEVENIRAYTKLQLLSHEYSFDAEYDIDDTLYDEYIPTFIIQPLVENAIEHGIDQLREGRGKLKISVLKKEQCIQICVQDNGMELYSHIGEAVFPVESYGYGVSNVHKRVQLLCGEKYGVKIYADKNGTTAQICLKADRVRLQL